MRIIKNSHIQLESSPNQSEIFLNQFRGLSDLRVLYYDVKYKELMHCHYVTVTMISIS